MVKNNVDLSANGVFIRLNNEGSKEHYRTYGSVFVSESFETDNEDEGEWIVTYPWSDRPNPLINLYRGDEYPWNWAHSACKTRVIYAEDIAMTNHSMKTREKGVYCQKCGKRVFPWSESYRRYNDCPHCGAYIMSDGDVVKEMEPIEWNSIFFLTDSNTRDGNRHKLHHLFWDDMAVQTVNPTRIFWTF